jgi:hypothetical protein
VSFRGEVVTPPAATPTLQSVYSAGASVALAGSPILLTAPAGAIGDLFRVNTNGGTALFDVTDNSSQVVRSAMADGASAVALIVDTTTAWANAGALLASFRNNGTEKLGVLQTGTLRGNSAGTQVQFGGNLLLAGASGFVAPTTDNTNQSGGGTLRWSAVVGYQHGSLQQAVTSSGAITINPTLGEHYQLTANGNVTGITVSAGIAGQRLSVTLVQNGAGTATWPTTMTNVRFPGGTFTKTTAANAVDVLWLMYNTSASKWDALATSANLS